MPSPALLERLTQLRLSAFREALEEQMHNPKYTELSFEDRLAILVDLECTRRKNSRIKRAVKIAAFPVSATAEDIDFSASRGLDRRFTLELAQGEWVSNHLNLIVLGPTGTGKSFISSALGYSLCRMDFSVRYFRTARFLNQLAAASEVEYSETLHNLTRFDLIILDDWMRDPLTSPQAKILLDILDDRFGHTSTLVASQVPVADWYVRFPDATTGEAILDRLVHNAHRIELIGESQRKLRAAPSMPNT
jgi:DNA replication protein DnaC